jgi:hypothetical protein
MFANGKSRRKAFLPLQSSFRTVDTKAMKNVAIGAVITPNKFSYGI